MFVDKPFIYKPAIFRGRIIKLSSDNEEFWISHEASKYSLVPIYLKIMLILKDENFFSPLLSSVLTVRQVPGEIRWCAEIMEYIGIIKSGGKATNKL